VTVPYGSGTVYSGSFYDKNGNGSTSYSPDGGDSISLYNDKTIGAAGDGITLSAGAVTNLTISYGDTYKFIPKFVYMFTRNPPQTTGKLYAYTATLNGILTPITGSPMDIASTAAIDATAGAGLMPMAYADDSESTPRGYILHLRANVGGANPSDSTCDRFTINTTTGELTSFAQGVALTKAMLTPGYDFSESVVLGGIGPFTIAVNTYSANLLTGAYGTDVIYTLSIADVIGISRSNSAYISVLAVSAGGPANGPGFKAYRANSNGTYTTLATSVFLVGNTPGMELLTNLAGTFLYVPDAIDTNKIYTYTVNTSSGAVATANNVLTASAALTSLRMYNGINALYVRIDMGGGNSQYHRAPLTNNLLPADVSAITGIGLNEEFYVTTDGAFAYKLSGSSLYGFTVNANTGEFTAISGGAALVTNVNSWYIDADNRFIYVANSGTNKLDVYLIKPTTGVLTLVSGNDHAYLNSVSFNGIMVMRGIN
jgi:6-phosphogluconolactonase (cycloisomerase 2 family)